MLSLPRFLLDQPRRIFLVDGLGACLTAILLLGVLVPLEYVFGMPAKVLYVLGAIAGVLAVYSLVCYRLAGQRWRPLLRAVSLANLLYCCLTLGLVIALWASLSVWGCCISWPRSRSSSRW